MSNKYKHGDRIPSDVLCSRLDELANVVTHGRDAVAREFTMRVPAEMDYDADLVLSAASRRIAELEARPSVDVTDEMSDQLGVIIGELEGWIRRDVEECEKEGINVDDKTMYITPRREQIKNWATLLKTLAAAPTIPDTQESERWKPAMGEMYWYVNSINTVDWRTHDGHRYDLDCFDEGNCYATKEEAESHIDSIPEEAHSTIDEDVAVTLAMVQAGSKAAEEAKGLKVFAAVFKAMLKASPPIPDSKVMVSREDLKHIYGDGTGSGYAFSYEIDQRIEALLGEEVK